MLSLSVTRLLDGFASQLIRSGSSNGFKSKFFNHSRLVWNDRQSISNVGPVLGTDDGDVFGKIGTDENSEMPLKAESLPDDDDGYDSLEINRNRKHILFYKFKLTSLIHPNHGKARIVEALKLFDEMKRDDRKKVRAFLYTLMISGAADNGYTEKAFELFEECLKHKIKPTAATYTALFNSCAECPFPEMGLQKAEWLRRWVSECELGITLNQTHYHAMIKAFAKHGDIKTCYEIVDEMTKKEIMFTTSTFNNLLVAAISQRENGFGEAIKLFRRMQFHKVPRELKTYNLLLRATKCGIKDKESFKKLLYEWINLERIRYPEKKLAPKHVNIKQSNPKISYASDKIYDYLPDGSVKLLEMESPKEEITSSKKTFEISKSDDNLMMPTTPNFLISSKFTQMNNILSINYDSLKDWKNRFILIGGMEGFLQLMTSEKIKPDIKTFTLMLDLIPEENQAEDNLILLLNQFNVKADTGFYNQIIKRRCFRGDVASAKRIFGEMQKNNIPVDLATFGVLASGCKNVKAAQQLLTDLESVGLKPNIQIMGAMMKKACLGKDIFTMKLIMSKMTKSKIPSDKRIIDVLALTIEEIDRLLWSIEKGKIKPFGHFLNPKFESEFSKLKSYFDDWAAKTEIEIHHPWDQFKYKREDWGYHKMHQYEKSMKAKILDRPDIKDAIKDGTKVNVYKLVHDM